MINRIDIKNFRCFESVDVPLEPLTVLIGQNDTGKTSLLRALVVGASGSVPSPLDVRNFHESSGTQIILESGREQVSVRRRPGRNTAHSTPISFGLFNLPPDGPSLEGQGAQDSSGPPSLNGAGQNVSALIDWLLRRDRTRFFAFTDEAKTVLPGVAEIEIATPLPELRRIELKLDTGVVIPTESISAGVRIMLFFLALAHHPSPPKLVLVEEPERSVHPKRLMEIVELLRRLTKATKTREAVQVLVTTHSPYLLDAVDPERDGVLVFRHGPRGTRTVHTIDDSRVREFLTEFNLGEIWFNEGEDRLVGGSS